MNLFIKDGKLVVRDGALKVTATDPADNCCCEPYCGCSHCNTGTAPRILTVTISGISNGTCSGCADLNGVYVLEACESDGSDCRWTTNKDVSCYGNVTCIASFDSGRFDVFLYDTSELTNPPCSFNTTAEGFRLISWGKSGMSKDCDTWDDDLVIDTDYMDGVCFGPGTCHVVSSEPCGEVLMEAMQAPTETNLLSKATSYSLAYSRWAAAGFPRRTAEEQASNLAICQGCEHFNNDKCNLCGCWLKKKVAMATESCPIQKWGDGVQTLAL